MPYVVTEPFADFAKGAPISDAAGDKFVEDGMGSHMVKVAEPEPEPAKPAEAPTATRPNVPAAPNKAD